MSKSSETTDHVYTINLSKAWLTPRYRRTDRIINMIKEFARRHMKNENIKIDQELNREIWRKGRANPPRHLRVRMSIDDNAVLVSFYQETIKDKEPDQTNDTPSETTEEK